MKKLLAILVLSLLWCNIGFAANYKKLIERAENATGEEVIGVIKHVLLAYEVEINIAKDCVFELKNYQEWGKLCKKLLDRREAFNDLTKITSSPILRKNMNEIAQKIDKKEKLSYISSFEFKQLLDDWVSKAKKYSELMSNVLFLKNSL